MPKKILNINNFSGGLNEKTTPRDLQPNEYQDSLNMNNEIPGKLVTFGESVNGPYTSNFNGMLTLGHGHGLHLASLDRDVDDESVGINDCLFVNDKADKTVRIVEINSTNTSGALKTNTIVYGDTEDDLLHMYTIDGSTKVIPSNVTTSNTNKPKVFEYFNYNRKLGSATNQLIKNVQERYITQDLYIGNIKGGTASNDLYDLEALHGPGWFRSTRESELYIMNPSVGGAQNISGQNYITRAIDSGKSVLTVPTNVQLNAELANYNGYNNNVKGSMVFIPWFDANVTANYDGAILVSKSYVYGFFVSKIYKAQDGLKEQESVPVYVGQALQGEADGPFNGFDNDEDEVLKHMSFIMVGRMGEQEDRYAGLKVYWARIKNYEEGSASEPGSGVVGPKYLFCEVDFEKGLRFAGKKDYNAFSVEELDTGKFNFEYPTSSWDGSKWVGKKVTELSTLEPFVGTTSRSGIGLQGTTFKTSTVINRRVYAGNVSYYNEDNQLVVKADRILKSVVNQFDNFPANNFIDVAIEDGDEIIKLASVKSKLLQFKKNKLFIINCSRDLEFIENTIEYKGCEKPYHVVQGTGFVAWFNRFGVYLYDGQRLYDIDVSKQGQSRFSSIYSKLGSNIVDAGFNESSIGYLPDTSEIVIVNKSKQILKYDIKSESWTEATTFEGNVGSNIISRDAGADFTNFVNLTDGSLAYCIEQNGGAGVKLRKWNNDPAAFTANGQILLKTKEFDMGTPSVNKSITTVYINYKAGENVKVKGFAVKADGVAVENHLGSNALELSHTANTFKTEKINVSRSDFKHVTSFGLIIYADTSGTIDSNFTINDLQIVFREKSAR